MKADAMKIADGVYWVGVLDWDLRSYHGYKLDGTTYNTYLVFGKEKVALIDNTYPGTFPQLLGRIKDAFKQEGKDSDNIKIDLIIQNHIETDHIGSLAEAIKKFQVPEVYCTSKAVSGIKNRFPSLENFDFNEVKTGDSLDLGDKTLAFLEAPMLHWPDSMFTFLAEDGILFSNDAFGQHLCLSQRYDDEISNDLLMRAAQKFYANLVTPSSPLVLRKLAEAGDLGIAEQIKLIAPCHGQIWKNPGKILTAYSDWASGVCKDKITFIYDTMHNSTQKMAHSIAEGVMSEGIEVKTYFLHEDERSAIVTDILDSKAICVGSPTMMNNPFPSLGDLIYYLNCLSFSNTGMKKKALVFGSKGWGGGSNKKLSSDLEQAGFEIFDQFDTTYIPHDDVLDQCYDLGKKLAIAIKN
jgi:flavorubredoxin